MIIAHDLGTTGDKASIHDGTGRLLAATSVSYPTDYGSGGCVEQNPRDWWEAVCQATRSLLEQTGAQAKDLAAVGFSGQMMGAVLLDERGDPLRPALIWADHRSSAQCDELVDAVGMERGYAITGHRLNPTYSLSKVMWVRQHQPELFARARSVCLAKDWIVLQLTGRLVTDPSDASSTNAFDQSARTWSAELLRAAQLDADLFPEVVPSATVVGGVSAAAAAATGLRAGTPVVIGGGDGPLAALGAGVVTPDDGTYAYLGSSSWVSFSATEPLHDPAMRTMTFDHVVPGHFVPTATMVAGAGSLQWITDVLVPESTPERFGQITGAAADVEAATDGLYFLPHLLGERSPYWNPQARGAFAGLSRHHGRAHLARAVLEGVAFNLATCIAAFREGGRAINQIDAIGGGAASDVWLQILADVWGATIRRRSVVEEANSLGAAITAGVATGTIDNFSSARDLSQVTAVFEPDDSRHQGYLRAHDVFLDAYGRLESWFPAAGRVS